jgi:uncharacterized protein (DUF924 family)
MKSITITTILLFWFGDPASTDYGKAKSFWFHSTPEIDQSIRKDYELTYKLASAGKLDDWVKTPQGCLALILVLDQFPRNMFRGTPQAYVSDEKALQTAKIAIRKGFDQKLQPFQRQFIYLPFMHSENPEDQQKSVELYKALGDEDNLKYAINHREIIMRFGRFPHRNVILNRPSTPEEKAFLQQPGSSF